MMLRRRTLSGATTFGLTALLAFSCTCTDPTMIPAIAAVKAPENLGQRAYVHVEKLVGFGERYTGSPGWKKAVAYISKELSQMGLKPRHDTWTNPVEKLQFTNISVTLPGTSQDKIVIGCHHDTKNCSGHANPEDNFRFVGANDSGSGVGLLLEIVRSLKDRERAATYEIVFFDGEESLPFKWDITRALFGSKRYVRRYQQARLDDEKSPAIRAFVLLDMIGARDLQIDDDENSDKELKDIFFAAAETAGHEKYFYEHSLAVVDDHNPFVKAQIRSIDLIDLEDNDHWHTADDTLDELSAESMQIVGEVVLTALPALETKYFAPKKVPGVPVPASAKKKKD